MTTETSAGAGELAEQAADSAALAGAARAGLVAYGLVHLLIGWSALRIAWGERTTDADSSGALRTLASQPLGEVLLGLVATGMIALALWQAGEAIWGYRDRQGVKRTRKRVSSAGKSLVYAGFGISAGSFAFGGEKPSSSRSQEERTSGVLAWPGGQTIVVVAGLIIIGVGVAHVVKGIKGRFRDELDAVEMSACARRRACVLGRIGYVAKGIALGLVGGLLAYAAWTFDPEKSRGLDGALRTIVDEPAGRFLLTAMALGFMAFGVFAVLQSRYRRM